MLATGISGDGIAGAGIDDDTLSFTAIGIGGSGMIGAGIAFTAGVVVGIGIIGFDLLATLGCGGLTAGIAGDDPSFKIRGWPDFSVGVAGTGVNVGGFGALNLGDVEVGGFFGSFMAFGVGAGSPFALASISAIKAFRAAASSETSLITSLLLPSF